MEQWPIIFLIQFCSPMFWVYFSRYKQHRFVFHSPRALIMAVFNISLYPFHFPFYFFTQSPVFLFLCALIAFPLYFWFSLSSTFCTLTLLVPCIKTFWFRWMEKSNKWNENSWNTLNEFPIWTFFNWKHWTSDISKNIKLFVKTKIHWGNRKPLCKLVLQNTFAQLTIRFSCSYYSSWTTHNLMVSSKTVGV